MRAALAALALSAVCVLGWQFARSGAEQTLADSERTLGSGPGASASEQLDLGRRIYREGRGMDPITAEIPASQARVPASVLPCMNCHGESGVGEPEGGIFPAEITWHALTKSYGARPGARARGPYSREALVWAITQGVDPAGNPLDAAMPRYRLSQRDMAALVAYLQALDQVQDPGVTETSVAALVLLPGGEAWAGLRASIRQALDWSSAQFQGAGRLFGRGLELRYLALPVDPRERRQALRSVVERSEDFVVLAPWSPGLASPLERELGAQGVPVVLGSAADDAPGQVLDSPVFALLPGPRIQLESLAVFAANRARRLQRPLGLLGTAAGVERIALFLGRQGESDLRVLTPGEQLPLRELGGLLAVTGARGLGTGARLRSDGPAGTDLYVLGADWNEDLARFAGGLGTRVLMALPKAPGASNASPWVQGLIAAGQRSQQHAAAQDVAMGTLALAVEALRRCGANPTRRRWVRAVESLYAWESGLLPPLTFDRNRRIGARGACIVEQVPGQAQLQIVQPWVSPGDR